uniref:Uncharacterized protein n=1 Tax=Nicotiana tabacum TaxID=4097 RepID=A0A1S3YBW6_TOBAC|nr:PREDICTED: uncharacterized protein LOC107774554 [Nicotiana tabacum]
MEEMPSKKSVLEREMMVKPVKEAEKKDDIQNPEMDTTLPPYFPQRLQKQKDDEVPKYAKYLREIVTTKRRHATFETVALTEECSAIVTSKLPPKLKDPECFTIPLAIRKHEIVRALCDLGETINLMPFSVFKQLELGAPRPTTIIL